jgi:hypothetical protein
MPDNPLLYLVLRFLCIPLAAFVVGAVLYQFRFRAVWCLVLTVAVVPYLLSNGSYFPIVDVLLLPALLAPSFAGYYFNKHILHVPEDRNAS